MGALPLLLFPLLEEPTLVPDVTLPTLLEWSMSPRGRLRPTLSMVLTVSDMPDLATAMLVSAMLPRLSLPSPLLLPATPTSPPPPPSPPSVLPLLPSLLSEELMPVLVVTSPTLLESSMLPKKKILGALCLVGLLIN